MSDSSDEGEPSRLRNYDDESDEDSLRPNKRRKTEGISTLRGRGLAFVQKTNQDEDEVDEQMDEQDDEEENERPTMGGFRSGFNIGEFPGFQPARSPSPEMNQTLQPEKVHGTGPSAFVKGGRLNQSSFAARMMAKMGHVEGQGLGRSGQGIAEPIQAQKQQVGTGVGFGGQPEHPKKKPPREEKPRGSRASTPGIGTPRLKGPPKKKYEVAAIESRGLQIPESMKIIIDATGTEHKTVSLSGYSTPNSDAGRAMNEEEKKQILMRKQLQQWAEAWDGQVDRAKMLEQEYLRRQEEAETYNKQAELFQDMASSFERVAVDDSYQIRPFSEVILRLQAIQNRFSEYMEALELPELCAATFERPFQTELNDNWDDPLFDPGTNFVKCVQSIGALLDLEKTTTSRHRKRTTYFESFLLKHWYPKIRQTLRDHWDVYDPVPAVKLFETWYPAIIPPWMSYKLLQEIVLPKILEAVRKFKRGKKSIPDIHEWVFDWWSIFSEHDLEGFHQLKVDIKTKVRFDEKVWPVWKDLLGTQKPVQGPKVSAPTTPAALPNVEDEVSFRDVLEEWCMENDLTLRNTGTADELGRRLYRLQSAERRAGGVLIYIQDDVVFDSSSDDPYALDDSLAARAKEGQRQKA